MDDFRQTLTNITKNLTKASSELIKTTKINLSISGEEDRLKSVYVDIGKKVHEIYSYGGSLGRFFDEKYLEICDIEKKLAELRGQLNITTGARACPKCRKPADKSSEFCPKCGTRMDAAFSLPEPMTREAMPDLDIGADMAEQPAASADPEIIIVDPAPSRIICKSCNTESDPGDKFCLSCGRML